MPVIEKPWKLDLGATVDGPKGVYFRVWAPGVYPFAPQNTYGGPGGLKKLINAAHRKGLAVILDVVYNHLGPEGSYLGRYGPYFTDRYRTPWGEDGAIRIRSSLSIILAKKS